jgi:hypothetical protein
MRSNFSSAAASWRQKLWSPPLRDFPAAVTICPDYVCRENASPVVLEILLDAGADPAAKDSRPH